MKPLRKIREIASAITLVNQAFESENYFRRVKDEYGTIRHYGMNFLDTLQSCCIDEIEKELFACSERDDELHDVYNKMCELIRSARADILEENQENLLHNFWVKYGDVAAEEADRDLYIFFEATTKIKKAVWEIGRKYGLIKEDTTPSCMYPEELVEMFITDSTYEKDAGKRRLIGEKNCQEFYSDCEMSVREWVTKTIQFYLDKRLDIKRYGAITRLSAHMEGVRYDNFQKQLNEELKRRGMKD